MQLQDCEVLDSKVLLRKGSFSIIRYWIKGWVNLEGAVKYIYGWSGKETELTVMAITPICVFEVRGV